LADEAEQKKPEFLKQRPKYFYYYEWMKERICETYPALPELVMDKLLTMPAGDLDLILQHPQATTWKVRFHRQPIPLVCQAEFRHLASQCSCACWACQPCSVVLNSKHLKIHMDLTCLLAMLTFWRLNGQLQILRLLILLQSVMKQLSVNWLSSTLRSAMT